MWLDPKEMSEWAYNECKENYWNSELLEILKPLITDKYWVKQYCWKINADWDMLKKGWPKCKDDKYECFKKEGRAKGIWEFRLKTPKDIFYETAERFFRDYENKIEEMRVRQFLNDPGVIHPTLINQVIPRVSDIMLKKGKR